MDESLYGPDPRFYPYSGVIHEELCVWGGKVEATTSLQVYHPCLESWRQLRTHGPPPPGQYDGASAHSGHYLYVYGGVKADGSNSGYLHRLDTKAAFWTQLAAHSSDGPMKKIACRMIVYKNSIILVGGVGIRNGHIQPGSEWRKFRDKDSDEDNTEGYTNEMHKYDLREGTWSSIVCTGTRPPPCSAFTLTMIDNHRAVLFGGWQGGHRSNDAYILDLSIMHWSKIPSIEGGPSPAKRTGHAAVCIGFGGDKPQLVVTGGIDADKNVLSDVWMMDLQSGRWKKVSVPNFQSRRGHCAAAFSLCPGMIEVVLFGGSISFPAKTHSFIANTNVLGFAKDTNDPKAEWILTDMAEKTQRGTNKRIREKMTKLSQFTHVITRSKQDAERRVQKALKSWQVAERSRQEAERGRQEAERGREDAERFRQEAEDRARDLERRFKEREQSESHWLIQRKEIYMTDQLLGGGGWGEVKIAIFRGAKVAAKVLYKQLQSPYYSNVFNREMNMASRVRHPNLVQFIGASMDEEMVILMELMSTSLRQHITSNAPAIPSAAFRTSVSLDVAKALNYLHLMQPHPIIHRDISSANVLLEPIANQKWRAKVTDYGSVNVQNQLKTENPGSPVYSAPEAHILVCQSIKMDVFSFGVLLGEMCTAKFPDDATRKTMIHSIKERQWVNMIQQCVLQDPAQRPVMSQIIVQLSSWQLS